MDEQLDRRAVEVEPKNKYAWNNLGLCYLSLRQGNDAGTQYRSAIYWTSGAQRDAALASKEAYQKMLSASGYGQITTEIEQAGAFYYAEDYHQQYLSKNPAGYCGLGGTGVSCPVGLRTGG